MRGISRPTRLALVLTLLALAGTGSVDAQTAPLPDAEDVLAVCVTGTALLGGEPVCADDAVDETLACMRDTMLGAGGVSPCSQICDGEGVELCTVCAGSCTPCAPADGCVGTCLAEGVSPCIDHIICNEVGFEEACIRCAAEGCQPCDWTTALCTGVCEETGCQAPCEVMPATDCLWYVCGDQDPVQVTCETCQAEQCSPCWWEPMLCYSCTASACQVLPLCEGARAQVCETAQRLVDAVVPCDPTACHVGCMDLIQCVAPCDTVLTTCTQEPGQTCRLTRDIHPVGACIVTPTDERPCTGVVGVHVSSTSGVVTCGQIATVWPGTTCSVTYVWSGTWGTHVYACQRTPALGQCYSAGIEGYVTVHEQCIGG